MPDTLDYMLLGYGISFAILTLIVGSLYWRYRSLLADDATLEQLEAETKQELKSKSETVSVS